MKHAQITIIQTITRLNFVRCWDLQPSLATTQIQMAKKLFTLTLRIWTWRKYWSSVAVLRFSLHFSPRQFNNLNRTSWVLPKGMNENQPRREQMKPDLSSLLDQNPTVLNRPTDLQGAEAPPLTWIIRIQMLFFILSKLTKGMRKIKIT